MRRSIVMMDKRARLTYDQPRRHKDGRTLAYVYLDDGTFVNAEIIRPGYGFAYTPVPDQVFGAIPAVGAGSTRGGTWVVGSQMRSVLSGIAGVR